MQFKIKKKTHLVFAFLWFFMPMVMLGHSTSQSSTVLVETKDGQWTLQVRAALSAFEGVVNKEYTIKAYNTLEEFEELVFKLMSKSLTLNVDGNEIKLNNPKIRLGHETLVVYLINMPENFKTVELNNNTFQEVFKSKNTFMILKNGVNRNLFTLDKTNKFAAKVELQKDKFVLLDGTKSLAEGSVSWYVLISLFVLGFIAFMVKIRKKNTLSSF